jgi:hypothetical protein
VADTTAITITAIVTTGVASGVIGPAVAARLEGRRDERRFRHERVLQDSAEVRRMIDGTADRLDAVITAFDKASVKTSNLSLIEKRGTDLLDELESSVVGLERALSRLIVRVGSDSPLADTCREVIDAAREVEFDLMGVSNTMDLAMFNDAPPPPSLSEEMDKVFRGVVKLKALRPHFDAAAHEVAGAIVE